MSPHLRFAVRRSLGGAVAIALSALVSAHAETIKPDQIAYDVKVSEDPAAKACILDLAIKGTAVAERVEFQLVVARMKRNAALAGPAMFGFAIEVRDAQVAPRHRPDPRAIEITSAAFVSERYVAAARPRTIPFSDGGWVASTLDSVEGGELVDAAADGKFQITYTRTRPTAARTYAVTSAPPHDVLERFGGCTDGLRTIE